MRRVDYERSRPGSNSRSGSNSSINSNPRPPSLQEEIFDEAHMGCTQHSSNQRNKNSFKRYGRHRERSPEAKVRASLEMLESQALASPPGTLILPESSYCTTASSSPQPLDDRGSRKYTARRVVNGNTFNNPSNTAASTTSDKVDDSALRPSLEQHPAQSRPHRMSILEREQQLRSSLDMLKSDLPANDTASSQSADDVVQSTLPSTSKTSDARAESSETAVVRSSLEQESKSMGSPAITVQASEAAVRSNLEQLESKLMGSVPTGSSENALRSNLEQLQSKLVGSAQTSSTEKALRSTLEQLESKLMGSAQISSPEKALRSNIEQLESKLMGSAQISSPEKALRSNLEQLENKLAFSGMVGTSTNGAQSSLIGLETKLAASGMIATPESAARASVAGLKTKLAAFGAIDAPEAAVRSSLEGLESKLVASGNHNPSKSAACSELEGMESKLCASRNLFSPVPGLRSLENLEGKAMGSAVATQPQMDLRSNLASLESKALGTSGVNVARARPSYYTGLQQFEDDVAMSQVKQLESNLVVHALASDATSTPGAYFEVPTQEQQQLRAEWLNLGSYHRPTSTTQHSLVVAPEGNPPASLPSDTAPIMSTCSSPEGETPNTGLVEASPVMETDNMEIGYALPSIEKDQEEDPVDKFKDWRRWICLGAAVMLIAGAITVPILFSMRDDGVNGEMNSTVSITPQPTPNLSPTPAPTPYVVGLRDFTLQAMENPESPQSKAYTWLRNDPKLANYSEAKREQRMALATFYYATDGNDWIVDQNWLSYNVDECEWFSKFNFIGEKDEIINYVDYNHFEIFGSLAGEKQCSDNGKYLELVLPNNNLAGSLPQEISLLSALQRIELSGNSIDGSLPTGLGLLTQLREMTITNPSDGIRYKTVGPLPSELGLLTELRLLSLEKGIFTGTIPTQLGKIATLWELTILGSDFTGTIPADIWKLTNLTKLEIMSYFVGHGASVANAYPTGSIKGTIPTSIGFLSKLEFLRIGSQAISGTIPSEIGLLSNLELLGFPDNQLTGAIPSYLGNLMNVTTILFFENLLTGSIPSELGLLSQLRVLTAWANKLSGSIPPEVWAQPDKNTFIVSSNADLTGTIPTEISVLGALSLSDTSISGPIPSELGMFSSIFAIDLSNSMVTGAIPSELANLPRLAFLELDSTSVSGTLPNMFASQTSLVSLMVNDTLMTGEVPDALCDISILHFDCPDMCGCNCPCMDGEGMNINVAANNATR